MIGGHRSPPGPMPPDPIEQEDELAEQIEELKEQRIELDEQLADMTHRLRELSHMEEAVRTHDESDDAESAADPKP